MKKILSLAIFLLVAVLRAAALPAVPAEADTAGWEQLSMQGKLSMEGLPVKPSVKIFMKRGESVIMSARAPFFGEVVRVEVNSDSITVINKHTRSFLSHPMSSVFGQDSCAVSDLQDILLGEVAFPGHGPLTPDLAVRSELSATAEGDIFMLPEDSLQYEDVEYGFVLDADDGQLLTFALMHRKTESVVTLDYLYGDEGWTLGLLFEINGHPVEGELTLSYPDYNPTPLGFTDAAARYKRTDLKGLLKF